MASASTPSPSSSSSPHTATQYLSSLLSQRGPNALPYREDMKLHIRQHLLNLMQFFPSLRARPADFVHNDGASAHLLQAEGTVPMSFQGQTYNIPVSIWLLEPYPASPPRVFVNPTKDMVIKRSHKHVDASGMVTLPYLQGWTYPRSNLVDLARALSAVFGEDPPLYTKPPSSANAQMQGKMSSLNGRVGSEFAASSSSSSAMPSPSRPLGFPPRDSPHRHQSPRMSSNPPPSQGSPNLAASNHGADDPQEVFRRNAIASLLDRLKLDIAQLQSKRESGMDSLVNTQSQLKQRKEALKQGVEQLRQEKEHLKNQLRTVLSNAELVQKWIGSQHRPKGTMDFVDIDDVFEPADPLSKQMLDCTSQDLALEDLLYSLDKAIQEGSIPVDVYLKQVRSLSREQFFHRAISEKIQAAQQRAHIAQMASRYPS
jgi:ESCRT-I complex subunit TSG101